MTAQYTYNNGKIYQTDCIDFLKNIDTAMADTVFADPPYNIGKAEWDDIGDQEEIYRMVS